MLLGIVTLSCSSSDDDNPDTNDEIYNYFPLNTGNSWTYNNTTIYDGSDNFSNQETITLDSSSEDLGVTYYQLSSNLSIMNQGFFTGILTNGNLIKAENQLVYNGEIDFNNFIPGLIENLKFELANIILYDTDANTTDILSLEEDQFTQTINIQGNNVPITFAYIITSKQEGVLSDYMAGEENFDSVIQTNITVNLKVFASLFGANIPILAPQDAIKIKNFYANDVGMVYSNTVVNYELEDLNIPNFPEIKNEDINYTQEIDSYLVNQ
ncbi:hypothetical protein [Mesonia aestuariivivens]|uniref:Uncharacterized protein n=1 Tax=Mesonia aestuariivivens TaxID=2796128 RepID=A0ABS6VYW7_9FLAO|nr:hypothetical protein [Mesonia aestuariivivens]MBW2960789.1 hypothetical protein [Mesonia aestuariivivens]